MELISLLTLFASAVSAVHLDIAFKRYSDTHCKVEMHGENSENSDRLRSPHCKTWKGEPYYSAMYLFGQLKSSDKVPEGVDHCHVCLLYTSPSPRDGLLSRMPSSA